MTAADLIAQTLLAHAVERTGPVQATCLGCRDKGWMAWREFYAHQAQAVTEALGLVDEWGAQFDDMDEHTGRGVLVRPSHAAAARSLIDPTDALVHRYVTPWKETDR